MGQALRVRPYDKRDYADLEKWRRAYPEAYLNLPYGFTHDMVETAVVDKLQGDDSHKIISLTGTMAVVLNPLIKSPHANRLEILESLIRADAALCYSAAKMGALQAFIAVPDEMDHYHRILKKYGYTQVLNGSYIFQKDLVPPVNRTLEQEQAELETEPEPEVAPDSTPAIE